MPRLWYCEQNLTHHMIQTEVFVTLENNRRTIKV